MKETYRYIRISLVVLFFIFSCRGVVEREREVRYVYTKSGEKIPLGGTLVIGIIGSPDNLNPLVSVVKTSLDIESLIFQKLLKEESNLWDFTPQLAKRWVFSDGRKKLIFHLRDDVYWTDGDKFTAEDVVFTHKMQTTPEVGWGAIYTKDYIDRVEALDDTTVVFHFSKIYPYQLADAVEGFILPEHLLKNIEPANISTAEFNRKPVGCGPFILKEWKTQQSLELVRNPNYYDDDKPYLDRIVFRIIPDRKSLVTQLKTGEIDFMESIPPRDFQKFMKEWDRGKSMIRPYKFLGNQYDYIGWNLIDPQLYKEKGEFRPNKLFGDRRVRQALTMALDREKIAEAVNYGMAIPMHGPIPLILWAYSEVAHKWPYDIRKARDFLAEAGWIDHNSDGIIDKAGIKFEFELISNAGNERRLQAATIVQEQLKKVGIKVNIRTYEAAYLFTEVIPKKQFDAALIGWSVSSKVDFTPLFHSKAMREPLNFVSYSNRRFDSLNDEARITLDKEKARKLWMKVHQLLAQDLPYTWLYYLVEGNGVHKRFRNVLFDNRGSFVNLEEWWIPVEERIEIDWLTLN